MKNVKKLEKDMFTERNDDFMPKEIVDTFFAKTTHKKSEKKAPLKRKRRLSLPVLLLSTTLALFMIFIILNMIRVFPTATESAADKFHYSENIIKSGEINRRNIEEIFFDGDAKPNSSFQEANVRLVTSGRYGRAALVMRFRNPVDLVGKNILIVGRSDGGTKKIKLLLKDLKNRFYESPEVAFSSSWGMKHIYLDRQSGFRLGPVKELKLEFGTRTTGNEEGSVIFLKNMLIRKTI